jgi:hypothetical protein
VAVQTWILRIGCTCKFPVSSRTSYKYANYGLQLGHARLLQYALGLSASVRARCIVRLSHRNQSYEGYQGRVEEECLEPMIFFKGADGKMGVQKSSGIVAAHLQFKTETLLNETRCSFIKLLDNQCRFWLLPSACPLMKLQPVWRESPFFVLLFKTRRALTAIPNSCQTSIQHCGFVYRNIENCTPDRVFHLSKSIPYLAGVNLGGVRALASRSSTFCGFHSPRAERFSISHYKTAYISAGSYRNDSSLLTHPLLLPLLSLL